MRSKSKSSKHSKSLGSHSALSVEKRKKIRKKKSRKSKKTIKKLFDHLRNESTSSCSTSSSNVTVVEVKNQNTDNKSAVVFNQPITKNDTLIVINDDDLVTNNEPCPLQCSTPLSHSKHLIKDNNTPETSMNNNSVILQNLTKEVEDLTKEINRDSYLTIDLTVDSCQNTNNQSGMNTVIDLVNASDAQDCTITSDSLSMSGDSDVTVLNTKRRKKNLTLFFFFFVLALSRYSGSAFLIMRRHVDRVFASSSVRPRHFKSLWTVVIQVAWGLPLPLFFVAMERHFFTT